MGCAAGLGGLEIARPISTGRKRAFDLEGVGAGRACVAAGRLLGDVLGRTHRFDIVGRPGQWLNVGDAIANGFLKRGRGEV